MYSTHGLVIIIMNYLLIGAFSLLIIWLINLVSPSWRLRKYGNKVPGPKSWPLVGSTIVFLGVRSILETIAAACDAYGSVVRVWIGKQLLFVLTDPADIEIFLNGSKFLEKSLPYRIFDSWLGTKGLLTSNGSTWQRHRKLLTSSFHFKILETSVDSMRRISSELCDRLAERVDKAEFDVFQPVQRCGVAIICETAMGVAFEKLVLKSGQFYRTSYNSIIQDFESFRNRENVDSKLEIEMLNYNYYLDAVHKLRTIGMERFFRPWLHSEWIFKRTVSGQIYYKSLRAVQDCITTIIQERKNVLEKKLIENERNEETGGQSSVKPFLDFLLGGSNFTDEEIENEVQTIMFGGSVSVPTTISFCLFLLSKYPDVQEKILQEIKTLKSEQQKEELAYQDYVNMKYLENVIKETLRLYTTVPLIARTVTQDIKLSSGHILPAGSVAGICLLHVHHNEKHFPNANQFIPERFENRNHERHAYAYIPFSAGPRNCIGQKYAMLEMKIVISTLIQRYRFLPSEKIESLCLETGFALVSLDEHPVRITIRTSSSSDTEGVKMR